MPISNTIFRHSFRLEGKEIDENFDYIKKLVPYVNVKEYGATADGTTDDREKIQLAINSMTSGGILFFPAGTYRIGTPGLAISSNMTLLGEPNSILKATDDFSDPYGNGSVLQNYTPPYGGTGNTNVSVENLKIDGNQLATRCILYQGGSRLSVKNCHTVYPWVSGAHIDVRDFDYGIIDNNYIEGNAYALGINCLGDCTTVQITNNRIINTLDSFISIGTGGANPTKWIVVANNICETTNAYGVDLFGDAEEVIIANNIIHDCHLGAIQGNISGSLYPKNFVVANNIITGGDTDAISLNCDTASVTQVIGNQIRNNTGSILVSQSKEALIANNILENGAGVGIEIALVNRCIINSNIVRGGISHGIYVSNADGYVISDNYLEEGTLSGITCEGIKNSVISNNVVKNFGQAGNATYKHGIQIRDGSTVTASTDNIISGNRCYDDQGSKTQTIGITIQQNSDYNLISNNSTRGNITAEDSAVGAHNRIGPEVFTL